MTLAVRLGGGLGMALATALSAAPLSVADGPLGVVRQAGTAVLVENHGDALGLWRAQGITNATLVHLDTHDDCRWIPEDRLQRLAAMVAAGDYTGVHDQGNLDRSYRYEEREENLLFDLGNFLYPSLRLGLFSRILWVVPQREMTGMERSMIRTHLETALHLDPGLITDDGRGLSLPVGRAEFLVTTLDALPPLPSNAVISVDIDFFAYPRALTDEHLTGALLWQPDDVCARLTSRIPRPAAVLVCGSVPGGYTPLLLRSIADGCLDALTTGRYPPDARRLLDAVLRFRTGNGAPEPTAEPADPVYRPAWQHWMGLAALARGDDAEARRCLLLAARESPVYAQGLLDASEVCARMGRREPAQAMIDAFESLRGRTTHSDAARLRLMIQNNELAAADTLSARLVDWTREPFALLLRGAVMAEQKRYDAAEAIYREILAMSPLSASAHYNLGLMCERGGRPGEAMPRYATAIAIRPDFALPRENLGYLLLATNRVADAVIHLQTACELAPGNPVTLSNLGRALIASGKTAEGIARLREAAQRAPGDADVRANFAHALEQAGRRDEAIGEYREALRLRPGWPGVERSLDALGAGPAAP